MYRPSSSMVDYTAERRKTERKMFPHYITGGGPTTQREVYEKEKFFIVCVCVCLCVCNVGYNRFEGGGGGGNDPWLCTDDLPLG